MTTEKSMRQIIRGSNELLKDAVRESKGQRIDVRIFGIGLVATALTFNLIGDVVSRVVKSRVV